MCACVCLCVQACAHACAYESVSRGACVHVYVCICVRVSVMKARVHVCARARMCTHTHIYIHTHTRSFLHTHTHTHTQRSHTYLAKDALSGIEFLGEQNWILGYNSHAGTKLGQPHLGNIHAIDIDRTRLDLHHSEKRLRDGLYVFSTSSFSFFFFFFLPNLILQFLLHNYTPPLSRS